MAVWAGAVDTSAYGNINMRVNLCRDAIITRTATKVKFNFGVTFRPVSQWTSNSVAAWYNNKQCFANDSTGNSKALEDVLYYAKYTAHNGGRANTTETFCYTYENANIDATTSSVNIKVGVGWGDWAGTKKGTITFSIAIPEYHGDNGKGTVNITDNGNNTFTIQVDAGAAGTNNKITNTQLAWGYYGENYKNVINDGGDLDDATNTNRVRRKNKDLNIVTPSNATRTVYAKCITVGEYNGNTEQPGSLAIKQYVAPNNPGVPIISYKRPRLTLKENWTFIWPPAIQVNSSSPVKGYRIRIYKNGTALKGLTSSTSNDNIGKALGNVEWTDRENTSRTITFNPVELGFEVGDTVRVGVFAYTRNGKGTQMFSSTHQISAADEVQNAGIMRVRVGNEWKEGQVYVRVNNEWKEAVSVNVRINNAWKEST